MKRCWSIKAGSHEFNSGNTSVLLINKYEDDHLNYGSPSDKELVIS